MALPSTWTQKGDGLPALTGIGINLIPGDVGFGSEVQRTSDNGAGVAATTGATSFMELFPGDLSEMGSVVFDYLPMDNAKRFYRFRHILRGYDAGTWSSWTTGHMPVQLNDQRLAAIRQVSGYPVKRDRKMTDGYYAIAAADTTGGQPAGDLYIPSTQRIRVGTLAASSFLTKTMDLDYATFDARAAATLTYTNGYLAFTSSGIQTIAAPLGPIPSGALLQSGTGCTALVNLGSTQELAAISVTLRARHTTNPSNVDDIKGGLIAAPGTSAVGNWVEVNALTGSTVQVTLGATCYASYELQYRVTSTNPANSLLARGRLQYLTSSYEISR